MISWPQLFGVGFVILCLAAALRMTVSAIVDLYSIGD